MIAAQEVDLDERIARIVNTLLRQERADSWLNSAEAAAHLRMSTHHLLRLRRRGDGPVSTGDGRLQRWRRSELDRWQSAPLSSKTQDAKVSSHD
jgi:hypothetical protein